MQNISLYESEPESLKAKKILSESLKGLQSMVKNYEETGDAKSWYDSVKAQSESEGTEAPDSIESIDSIDPLCSQE